MHKKMKKKILIFLIALIFSFIPFYRIFFKNGIIANIDFTQFFLFNPNFLERYPYVWNEYFSGAFNIFYIVNSLALVLISSFFSFLGLSVLWINRFWLVFPFFLYIISVYFFIKTFLKEFNFSLLEIILFLAFAVFSPLTSHYLSLGWQEAYFLPLAGTFFMFSFFFKF